eukprot:scaffold2349_cov407-Prasinococcus_capsulatus_cf.AAC.15
MNACVYRGTWRRDPAPLPVVPFRESRDGTVSAVMRQREEGGGGCHVGMSGPRSAQKAGDQDDGHRARMPRATVTGVGTGPRRCALT